LTGIPKDVQKLIVDDKWALPPPGSKTFVGKPSTPNSISTYQPPASTLNEPVSIYEGPVSSGGYTRATPTEMNEWMAQFGNDLSPAELKAFRDYTGSGYRSINSNLRNGIDSGPTIRNLDAGMKPLPRDTQLIRNVSEDVFGGPEGIQNLGGQVFADKGYLSTSIDGNVFQNSVQIVIDAPQGTMGRWVSNGVSSQGDYEKEVILARGTRMIVTKVTQQPYGSPRWIVNATVIAQ
jgi:hypothetical protein